MTTNLLTLIIGLLLLVRGSDYFINAASRIAKRLGISEFTIGLTLVAVGTSLPELAYALYSSFRHESGLIMGNIVGANIANLSLIIGITAIVKPIKVDIDMLERDGYFVLAVALILITTTFDSTISRLEGGILIAIFIGYTIFLFETKPEYIGRFGFLKFTKYFIQFGYFGTLMGIFKSPPKLKENKINNTKVPGSTPKDLFTLIISGAFVVLGAKLLVDNAVYFTKLIQAPAAIIGILISIGTTLPEMSVGISAARKGLGNIVLGNVLGSCVTNTLFILGTSSLISPVKAGAISINITTPIFLLLAFLILVFIKKYSEIRRKEGIILSISYLLFISTMFIFGLLA